MSTQPNRDDAITHVYELILANECEAALDAARAIRELDDAERIRAHL